MGERILFNYKLFLGLLSTLVASVVFWLRDTLASETEKVIFSGIIGAGISLVFTWITDRIIVGNRPWDKPLRNALVLLASRGDITEKGVNELAKPKLTDGTRLLSDKTVTAIRLQVEKREMEEDTDT